MSAASPAETAVRRQLSAGAIIFDDADRVLLVRRNDTRTWALPGGSLEDGELPNQGVLREVREETGLLIEPEHLAGLFFIELRKLDLVSFLYRGRAIAGPLRPSPETPELGFFSVDQLPRPMLDFHRRRLEIGLAQRGGHPVFYRHYVGRRNQLMWLGLQRIIYPFFDALRRVRGQPRYVPPPSWQFGAFTIITNEVGRVLWVRRRDRPLWNLPGGGVDPGEAPWDAAVRETWEETGLRITLNRLAGVYFKAEKREVIFSFAATAIGGQLTTGPEAEQFAYFAAGGEPVDGILAHHVERVADAIRTTDRVTMRFQDQLGAPAAPPSTAPSALRR